MTHPPAPPNAPRLRALWAALALAASVAGCAVTPATTPDTPGRQIADAPTSAGPVAAVPAMPSSAPDANAEAPTPTVAIDPLEPDMPVNPDDRAARADLWQRVRDGYAMPDLDSDIVHEEESWYANRPDYVQRMTERGGRYLYHIVEEVERRHLPTELALLPFIESAFNPQAMSTAKASGMWQFVPSTGRDYLLRQNVFRDDRRDVLASTRAALDHLVRLHEIFGDWQLTLAAYNWGEGNVQRAMARNQKLGLPTDYASLKMPRETQHYLPKLQAVKNIVLHPDTYALHLPPLVNHPYFLSVPIQRDIDIDLAARYAGVSLDEFKTLNPQMNQPVLLAAGTPQVLLPYDNATEFASKISAHRGPMATWTAWTAPRTLRPADAARMVGMSEDELRNINRIPPRMLVKAGSTLLVPRGAHRVDDVSSQVADNATISLSPDVPPLRRVALRAGKHDSVAAVARRYGVGAAQVAAWNKVGAGATFRAGQTVVVFVVPHRVPVRSSARVATSVRKATTASPTRRATAGAPTAQAAAKKPTQVAKRARGRVRVAATNSSKS